METLKFKTNIKCSGCVARVTDSLNETAGRDNWEVNIQTPEKVLTVVADGTNSEAIIKAVEQAGYNAEPING